MRKLGKWLILGLGGLTALIVVGIVALGLASDTELAPDVTLTAGATLEDGRLVITGTTNIPDGALLAYEVQDAAYATGDGTTGVFMDGSIPVSGGTYSLTLDAADLSSGPIGVWVAFQPLLGDAEQLPDAIATYGAAGEYMLGPQVTRVGGISRVEATLSVTKP